MGYGSVTVGTASTLLVDANTQRLSLIIYNNGPESICVAQDSSVTSANGIVIAKGGNLTEDNGGTKMYCGPFYAITGGTGSNTVNYWERVR